MSMCRVFSCVGGRGCLLWPVHSLGKTLLAFALLHFVFPRPNLPVTPGISWLPTFAFQSPVMKRKSLFFDVSSRRSCWSSWNHSTSVSLALVIGAQTWITVMLNGLSWKWTEITFGFEIAPKYCISNSFVDYEGYSISSKGFLPIVVDTVVIWIKFTHSGPL